MGLNTVTSIDMMDGTSVDCTLTYRALLQLSSKDKAAYDEYNKIFVKGAKTEIQNLRILHTAYLCAWILADKPMREALSFDEFIDSIVPDRLMVSQALTALLNPKKALDSAAPSAAE